MASLACPSYENLCQYTRFCWPMQFARTECDAKGWVNPNSCGADFLLFYAKIASDLVLCPGQAYVFELLQTPDSGALPLRPKTNARLQIPDSGEIPAGSWPSTLPGRL